MPRDPEALRRGYDAVASDYAETFGDELDHKELDRKLLDRFAHEMCEAGPVLDAGCGPGQITAYLFERGVDVRGIDFSPEMIRIARELHPRIDFSVGDMLELALPDALFAGLVAFYSIIHVPRDQVERALAELRRVLRPQGRMLLSFHVSDTNSKATLPTLHVEELLGHEVSLDFEFYSRAEMEAYLQLTGWAVDEVLEREPYPDIEAPTRRAYFLARRPPES